MEANNMAAMRKALEMARPFVKGSRYDIMITSGEHKGMVLKPKDTLALIDAALSASPRNCEVGTQEEQSARFDGFCHDHRSPEKGCGDCPLNGRPCCELAWAQMPYEGNEVAE